MRKVLIVSSGSGCRRVRVSSTTAVPRWRCRQAFREGRFVRGGPARFDARHACGLRWRRRGRRRARPTRFRRLSRLPSPRRRSHATEFWRALSDSTLDRLIGEPGGRQSGRPERARAGARRPGSAFRGGARSGPGRDGRRRVHPAADLERDVPDRLGVVPRPGHLGRRLRRVVGARSLRPASETLQAQGARSTWRAKTCGTSTSSLTAELARSYFELRGAQEQLAVAERNAENQRRTLEVTRQRLDAGRGTAFDTERAQSQLSLTLASIPPLQASVADAQYRIGVLVGRPPAAVASELQVAAALPELPAVVEVGAPDSVVRARPDVAVAERQLAAERAFVGAAKADYLPRFFLGGSAGFTATTLDSLGEHGTFRYAVGPSFSWPALNLGRIKTRVDAASARRDEAEAQYNQTVLLALQDVETSLSRYRTARSRVAAHPGRGDRQRARRGAGPAPVHRWRGGLPSGARRGADPARRGEPARAGPHRRGDGIRGALQGARRSRPVLGRNEVMVRAATGFTRSR